MRRTQSCIGTIQKAPLLFITVFVLGISPKKLCALNPLLRISVGIFELRPLICIDSTLCNLLCTWWKPVADGFFNSHGLRERFLEAMVEWYKEGRGASVTHRV